MVEFKIMETLPDLYTPSEEEERDYWSGKGSVTFFVQQNIPKDKVFEIEVDDYTGCVGGGFEMVGYEYFITDMLGLDIKSLKEGHTYTVDGITVYWMRGDGWNTDDDCEYSYESFTSKIEWKRYLEQKLTNLWWQTIGWKIHARRKR